MAFDEGLAERVRDYLAPRTELVEKRMFGGLCFMTWGHMCCGIVADRLMVRVGEARYTELLRAPGAHEMDFTGRPLKGMLYVEQEAVAEDDELAMWLDQALAFVGRLPPKG